jgi:beta-1,4-mannosyl-glycoprotein beta-1,4-N-acetylglucosaminyltransferase
MEQKIVECLIFNNEIDLLVERLHKSYDYADKFVIVESEQTFSGKVKSLSFKKNEKRFLKWKDKIEYFVCPPNYSLKLFDFECYQRNYILECLKQIKCSDKDIIFISDVDEFININNILTFKDSIPFRFETSFYYYFSNLKTNQIHKLNICVYYRDIKNKNIGNRDLYLSMFPKCLVESELDFGKHFSFLFGFNAKKYQDKITSFSHSEYDNYYYKDPIRLKYFINAKKDILERNDFLYQIDNHYDFISPGLKKYETYQTSIIFAKFSVIVKCYIFILQKSFFWGKRIKIIGKRLGLRL